MSRWFPKAEFYHDDKCKRCGQCCRHGKSGIPCAHLQLEPDGKHRCNIYQQRLGARRYVNGKAFECIGVQEQIERFGGREGCAYVAEIRAIRKAALA